MKIRKKKLFNIMLIKQYVIGNAGENKGKSVLDSIKIFGFSNGVSMGHTSYISMN